jgi:peptide/nickel transport system substrate-binding protein
MKPHRWMLLLVLFVTGATACQPGRPEVPRAQDPASVSAGSADAGRALVVGLRVEPSSLSSKALTGGGVKMKTSTRLFNASLDIVDDRGVPRPYLAEALPRLDTESWRTFPDGRMETSYRLKPDLTWHDGMPFTADAYVFAWQVYATPDLGAANTMPISMLEEVVAPDDRTVIFRWRQPYPGAGVLQEGGNISRFPPLPRHVLERDFAQRQWEAFMHHPFWTREYIGLGPYKLDRWEPGEFIEGSAFAGHVLGRPNIGRVRLIFVSDDNAGLAGLLSGTMHLAADDAIQLEQGVIAKREWQSSNGRTGGPLIVVAEVWRAVHLQFRQEYANPRALLDVRVRRALAHTLDKQALNEALYDGEGVLADTLFPPSGEDYPVIDQAITKYAYDPRRAEQLMADAGFSKGSDGFFASASEGRLTPELKTNASSQNEKERAVLAARWRAAGFDMEEAVVSASQARDIQTRSTYRALYNYGRGLGIGNLPNFLGSSIAGPDNRWTGANRGGWAHPEYDRLLDTYNATLDRQQGAQVLARIARLMSDELPALPLYYDLGAISHMGTLRGPRTVSTDSTGLVTWNVHEWTFGT